MTSDNLHMKRGNLASVQAKLEEPDSLIAAIVQDRSTKEVLMVAWMNREALNLTLSTKRATFWSRSRKELWVKGQTSGNVMHIHELRHDCDSDALLLLVDPAGPACHTGEMSCFHFQVSDES